MAYLRSLKFFGAFIPLGALLRLLPVLSLLELGSRAELDKRELLFFFARTVLAGDFLKYSCSIASILTLLDCNCAFENVSINGYVSFCT